jgi:uncharacterized protein YaaR (DUF327 family)
MKTSHKSDELKKKGGGVHKSGTYDNLKAYKVVRIELFVYIKSCQYSMFHTNKMFWTKSQV